MLVYEVNVAPSVDSDVVTRRLKIVVDGQDGGTIDTPGNTVRFGGLKFNDGANVEMFLTDIDDAGNESPPAVHRFVAKDTIAPGIPGGFGVTLVEELVNTVAPLEPAMHVTAHSKLDGKTDGGKVGPASSRKDGKDDGDVKGGPPDYKVDGKTDGGDKTGPNTPDATGTKLGKGDEGKAFPGGPGEAAPANVDPSRGRKS